ncbi:hypothetical protein BSKO_07761 [Bryopsis sp. KO-2023]|nr:hypothetical protein BSKO_07761 [Bryopsis sp. KO-2023]
MGKTLALLALCLVLGVCAGREIAKFEVDPAGASLVDETEASYGLDQTTDLATTEASNDFYQTIYVQNKCDKQISVAAHYQIPWKSDWKTEGWWNMKPGAKFLIFQTRNGIVYLHAHISSNPSTIFGTPTHHWDVHGKSYGFFEWHLGGIFMTSHTRAFTCGKKLELVPVETTTSAVA